MKKRFLILFVAMATFLLPSCRITSDMASNTGTPESWQDANPDTLSEGGKNKLRLMNYLQTEVWGTATLSGQMDLTWDDSIDMLGKVHSLTGKYPAISGYDFMNIGLSGWSGTDQTEEALAWWNNAGGTGKHGIVTFCWHWRDPANRGGEFYSEKTDFTIPMEGGKLDTDSSDFLLIQADLDKVATELATLRDAGVPVLWRPLHEAGGDPQWNNPWFWWGSSGTSISARATAYQALYVYMHDCFTNTKGLDNLIWVWNGQVADYYPGDEYVDIISEDIYATAKDYGSQHAKFDAAKDYTNNDYMVALSENGTIPHPDYMKDDSAQWLYFMTWNDGNESGTNSSNYWEGEYYNSDSHKKEVYVHNAIITLDELPDLTTYQLP